MATDEQQWDEAAAQLGDFVGAPAPTPAPEPQAEAPEPAAEPDPPAQQEPLRDPETQQFTTEEKLRAKYGDRFSSIDELLEDYDSHRSKVGSMANEVGEARQQLAYYQGLLQQQAQPQEQQWSEDALSQFDEYAIENPQQAADWARERNDQIAYERAMDMWYSQDVKQAARYEAALASAAGMNMMQQQYTQQFQPLQQQYEQSAQSQALYAVMQKYPDFNNYGQQMVEISERFPDIAKGLQNPNPQAKEAALEAVFLLARGSTQAQPAQPGQNGQTATAAPGLHPALAAHVANPSSIPPAPANMTARDRDAQFLNNLWEQGDDNG